MGLTLQYAAADPSRRGMLRSAEPWLLFAGWCVCLAGTGLIWGKVESSIAVGPALFTVGALVLAAGVKTRHVWTIVAGSGHLAVCLLFFGLVQALHWGPSDARRPFQWMSATYALAAVVPMALAFSRARTAASI